MRTVIVILLLALASPAHADRAAAEAHFRTGASAYKAQNFIAASEAFELAYTELPLPEIAFSAAQAYRRRYQAQPEPRFVQRAAELYTVYLQQVTSGGKVREASDHLETMNAELARLDKAGKLTPTSVQPPEPPRTRLGVSVTIARAAGEAQELTEVGEGENPFTNVKATLDGQPVDAFTLVEVTAGPHTVTASADGYRPAEKQVVAADGDSKFFELELVPLPAKLAIKTEGGARIAIDGRPASGPLLEVPAGKHLVTITRSGREPFARELAVARGQELTVEADLVATGRRRAVPYVLGGAALLTAATLTTAIMAVVRDGQAQDLRETIRGGNAAPTVADDLDDRVASRDTYVTASWVLGGAALVTTAVGVGLLLFDHPSAESARVTPIVTSTSATVGVSGSF
jgi:hypothetical protein